MHGLPIYLIFIYMKPDFGQTRCGWGCSMQIWHSVTYVINVLCKCTCVVCYGVKYVHTEQGGGEELIFILSVVIVQWCTVLLQWGPLQTFIIPVFIIVLIIFIVIPSGSAGRLQGHPFCPTSSSSLGISSGKQTWWISKLRVVHFQSSEEEGLGDVVWVLLK